MAEFDLVLRGGRVATAEAVVTADIGIVGEQVAAVGRDLGPGREELPLDGAIVTPGGVDSHCHIEQLAATGLRNADTFESATRAALMGGTTTVIPFAAQHRGDSLRAVVDDYHRRARRGALADYAFHMILTDPRPEVLERELPPLVRSGHSSLKVYLTYERLRVDDEQLLEVLAAARRHRCLVCVHAENHGMIAWLKRRLVARGHRAPRFHGVSHPRLGEAEAVYRVAAMSALLDQPVMIFHLSCREGVEEVRRARARGVKLFAETCTQYLLLDECETHRPGVEGAMWMCSPPLRAERDREALWRALEEGVLDCVSSDHAPYRMDETGKLARGPHAGFHEIANGLPGIELRMPLLFDAMVQGGRLDLCRFVALTCTAPARIYGLHPKKGTIVAGADADLVVWDAERTVTIAPGPRHDNAGYTPYAGRSVRGWPRLVFLRGRLVVEEGRLLAEPGSGRFLPRSGGEAAAPRGRTAAELDPERNGGARLLD